MQARQYGEDGLLRLQNLLVQRLVGLVERGQSRRAVDDGYGVYLVKLLLTVVNGYAQLLGCSSTPSRVTGHGAAAGSATMQPTAL